jgi:hypothetical protein
MRRFTLADAALPELPELAVDPLQAPRGATRPAASARITSRRLLELKRRRMKDSFRRRQVPRETDPDELNRFIN